MTESRDSADNSRSGPPFRDALVGLLPHLRAFARGLCGKADRADDLVQDTVLRAWSARDSFAPGTNLKAWVFTIMRNHFLNDLRRDRSEGQLDDDVVESLLVTNPEQEETLGMTDIQRALERLPAIHREALLLVGASGFTYEEAAHVCGVRVGTVKSRVSRGRVMLSELLGEAEAENSGAG